jgi:hypothetical protein
VVAVAVAAAAAWGVRGGSSNGIEEDACTGSGTDDDVDKEEDIVDQSCNSNFV